MAQLFPIPLTWWMLLDLLVLAAGIWLFVRLVRGTRAAQMLAGLAAVALLVAVLRRIPLPFSGWIISRVLPFAGFAVIVVFQAEIRHALARLGRIVTFTPTAAETEAYDDLVMAAKLFSEQRTGALMVIERETGLRTYVESGVIMDARLSYDLLCSLFHPASPLHDGAVILQRDRIAAAACFLPLSLNPKLSNQLGTRHRAAIGVTEETDALAIVVSEETGQIALASAGQIERGLTVDQLRERIGTMLGRFVHAATLPTPMDEAASTALDKPRSGD